MAAETAAAAGGSDAVANRLSRLNQKMDEAAAATSRAKNVGRVMTVVILLVALFVIWLLFSPILSAVKQPEPYQVAVEKELKETIIPALMDELKSEEVQVAIKDIGNSAVEKLKERDEEIYAATDKEIRAFVDNMTEWGTEQLTARRDGIKGYVETRITEVAPELKDEQTAQTVMANASKAMENAVNRIVEENLNQHIQHLISIGDQIQTFPVPEDVAAMSDDELSEALINELGLYSMAIFQSSLSPGTSEFLRQAGSGQPESQ